METNHTYKANPDWKRSLTSLRNCDLGDILRALKLSPHGKKSQLVDRIYDFYDDLASRYTRGKLTEQEVSKYYALIGNEFNNFKTPPRTVAYKSAVSPPKPPDVPSTSSSNGTNGFHAAFSLAGKPLSSAVPPKSAPNYDSCIDENPFFQKERVLYQGQVISIHESRGKKQSITFQVDLKSFSAHAIQIFCFEGKYATGEPVHVWPGQNFAISVNNRPVTLVKAHKKVKDQLADVTNLSKIGLNTVEITSQSYAAYNLMVVQMKRVKLDTLVEIVTKKTVDFDTALGRVKQLFQKQRGGDEIEEISSKISLRDPLTRTLVQVPIRASTCGHIGCFELQSYLAMNERVPRWKCPLCNRSALFKNLLIDTYVQKIMRSVPSDTNEVEIQPDASWNIVGEKKRKAEAPPTQVHVEVLDSSDDEEPQNNKAYFKKEENGNGVEPPPNYEATNCFICGAEDSRRCAGCKSISYCGREHQSQDWPRHKSECAPSSKRQRTDSAPTSPRPENSPKPAPPVPNIAQPPAPSVGNTVDNAIVLSDSE
eukprot:TRINITY_DN2100_c0_g1_i1.p1 TRINITY_DN2100_c0_g1~~TRINITY_DN2100_c0_g1_i1.p1  ORF type:complete len:538 (+),score=106.56 TRINITY_DN2100_c0_g1_i1:105-1718(+)